MSWGPHSLGVSSLRVQKSRWEEHGAQRPLDEFSPEHSPPRPPSRPCLMVEHSVPSGGHEDTTVPPPCSQPIGWPQGLTPHTPHTHSPSPSHTRLLLREHIHLGWGSTQSSSLLPVSCSRPLWPAKPRLSFSPEPGMGNWDGRGT